MEHAPGDAGIRGDEPAYGAEQDRRLTRLEQPVGAAGESNRNDRQENQQQQKEEGDCGGESSACEGMGPLAHSIWRTEEHIRAILLREDTDYGAVPDALHGKLWMLASGAQLEMRRNKGLYERLLVTSSEVTEATRQIDVDLHRTVSDDDKEWWSDEKSGMMRRVLVAYSFYNPSLGYCQGLNYIVARILQYLDEEEAFYLLIAIIRLVPDDYYTTMVSAVGSIDKQALDISALYLTCCGISVAL